MANIVAIVYRRQVGIWLPIVAMAYVRAAMALDVIARFTRQDHIVIEERFSVLLCQCSLLQATLYAVVVTSLRYDGCDYREGVKELFYHYHTFC